MPSINVDGHFLIKPVDELFHEHELLTVPFITGVNSDEGGWLLAEVSVNGISIAAEPVYVFVMFIAIVSFFSSLVLKTGRME